MKKICILFLTTIMTLCFSQVKTRTVFSQTPYYRIITDDTPFYSEPTSTEPLFILPYTYYVKVIGTEGNMAHIECYSESVVAIDGYTPLEKLYADEQTVESPYLNLSITTCDTAILYSDEKATVNLQYIFKNRSLIYYGSLVNSNGENLFFVSYNGKLGYVKEGTIMPFEVPAHPNPLTFLEVQNPETPPQDTEEENPDSSASTVDNDTLRFIIILCLIFAGIIGLFIALKSKSKTDKTTACGYYDENDYE